LRALTRAREDLVVARVAMANQLRAELERFWPGPVGLFADLDSPISLAFLARYPSPTDAKGLGEKRLAGFLKSHGYSSRKTPARLVERLRSAPAGRAGDVETRTRWSIVLHLTRTLQIMVEQIRELESEIAEALDAHPDGEIFRSFFRTRTSLICAATLLAEIGDCRRRYPHRDAIAAQAGHAPVAVESGKRKSAKFRWACNKRLRRALDTVAMSTVRWNPWAAERYAQARQRAHNHRRALRSVGRAWSRILWRCWQTRTPYDPARHTGLQQHITVTIPSPSGPGPTTQPPSEWPLTSPIRQPNRPEVDTGRLSRSGRPRSGRLLRRRRDRPGPPPSPRAGRARSPATSPVCICRVESSASASGPAEQSRRLIRGERNVANAIARHDVAGG